jgi:hypothetical protein
VYVYVYVYSYVYVYVYRMGKIRGALLGAVGKNRGSHTTDWLISPFTHSSSCSRAGLHFPASFASRHSHVTQLYPMNVRGRDERVGHF